METRRYMALIDEALLDEVEAVAARLAAAGMRLDAGEHSRRTLHLFGVATGSIADADLPRVRAVPGVQVEVEGIATLP